MLEVLKISRVAAIALLVALGYKTANENGGWEAAKVKVKLKKLKDNIGSETKLDDKEQQKLLTSILTHTEKNGKIEVIDESAEEKKTAKGKAKPAAKKSAAKKEKPKAEKKAAKSKKRIDCICEVLKALPKTGLAVDAVVQKANSSFIKAGGEDNASQTLHHLRVIVPVLKNFNIVVEKDKKFYLA